MTKFLVTAAAALALIPAVSFAAKDVKPGKMTCQDFVELDETLQPRIVYFIEGATKTGKPEEAVVAVDDVASPVLWVLEECKKAPKATVWQKVENWVKAHSRKL